VLPYGLPSSINGRIPGNDITFIKRNSDASVTNACAIVHSAASVILTRCNFGHHSERNNATLSLHCCLGHYLQFNFSAEAFKESVLEVC